MSTSDLEPLDHYRADDDVPVDPGVYRVVGRDDETVTLLRVAEDGKRVNSGVVVRLPRTDLDALAPAGNPDAGWGRLRNAPGTLAERPLPTGFSFLLVAYGTYEFAGAGDLGGLLVVAAGVAVLWLLLR